MKKTDPELPVIAKGDDGKWHLEKTTITTVPLTATAIIAKQKEDAPIVLDEVRPLMAKTDKADTTKKELASFMKTGKIEHYSNVKGDDGKIHRVKTTIAVDPLLIPKAAEAGEIPPEAAEEAVVMYDEYHPRMTGRHVGEKKDTKELTSFMTKGEIKRHIDEKSGPAEGREAIAAPPPPKEKMTDVE
jgi:hypothetical protein